MLDVVYNHLGPSGNHLQEFGPYFTDKYGTPWGAAFNLDDADSFPRFFFSFREADEHTRTFLKWRLWKERTHPHMLEVPK